MANTTVALSFCLMRVGRLGDEGVFTGCKLGMCLLHLGTVTAQLVEELVVETVSDAAGKVDRRNAGVSRGVDID